MHNKTYKLCSASTGCHESENCAANTLTLRKKERLSMYTTRADMDCSIKTFYKALLLFMKFCMHAIALAHLVVHCKWIELEVVI